MKLELKHLSPYLPYGLRIKTKYGVDTMFTLNEHEVNGDHEDCYSYEDHPNVEIEFKPILRPLSDLTNEINVDGVKFKPSDRYKNLTGSHSGASLSLSCHFICMTSLFSWHFDVFGLIEKGLAIDINTLK